MAYARLLYHRDRCSLFIIDDLFAAVDVHVGRRMFDRGVNGLLAGTTRIIAASSQQDLLSAATIVIKVHGSKVVVEHCRVADVATATASPSEPSLANDDAVVDTSAVDQATEATEATIENERATKSREAGKHLTMSEARAAGAVSARVIRTYYDLSAPGHGGKLVTAVGVCYLVGQTIRVMCDVWIVWWADAASNDGDSTAPDDLERRDNRYWIWTLCVWNATNIVYAFTRSFWCAYLSAKASEEVHKNVLGSLLAAPLIFFHRNPPGRILNRLSTDLHKIDTLLPDILYQFLDNFVLLFSAVVLAVVAVPWLFVLLVLFGYFYWQVQELYRTSSRELHRLDSTTKSPIFGLCSESVSSRVTIRAFGVVEHFTTVGEGLIDKNLKVCFGIGLDARLRNLTTAAPLIQRGAL